MDLNLGHANQAAGNAACNMLGAIVGMQENMIDDEIRKLDVDNLDADDIARIRARRADELRLRAIEESEWARNGHGNLGRLSETKDFFAAAKASRRLVVHFSRPTSHHCVALGVRLDDGIDLDYFRRMLIRVVERVSERGRSRAQTVRARSRVFPENTLDRFQIGDSETRPRYSSQEPNANRYTVVGSQVALDGHLGRLAALHRETRFCTMDAEKTPYLCDKILADPDGNIVIPTILLVVDGKVSYHVRGLNEVGGERCTCEMVATVLHAHGLIEGEAAKHEYGDEKPQFGSVDEYRAHAIREGFFDQGLDADDDFSDDEYTGDAQDA